MEIVLAGSADLDRVMEIIGLCVRQMREAGSDQWDEIYPSREILAADIAARSLYLLRDAGESIAAIVLNEWQSPEYAALAWRREKPLVVHRLCVRPDRQKAGVGRLLMDFAETFAAQQGYDSIRLDTYTGNERAAALYDRRGYQIAGYVRFPRRRLPFVCFELLLDQRPVLPQ
ncbi:MAG TPA: GNAT family N-acetyltransferase [Bryobacteraceae bacterium]|nr:GNAT family N-acetyltransferase [Bryobacteraceae bacterium]